MRLVAAHAPAGEDEVERGAGPDEPGEADGAPVDEGHAPAAAEDAEHGVVGGDAEVAPQGQLEPAGDGVSLDRGDDRLGQ